MRRAVRVTPTTQAAYLLEHKMFHKNTSPLKKWLTCGLLVVGAATLVLLLLPVLGRWQVERATLWVAAGDVDQNSVVLWARSLTTGTLAFEIGDDAASMRQQFTTTISDPTVPVTVEVADLAPATGYRYRAQSASGERASGHFRTPAMPDHQAGLHFGVSGDWRASLAPFVAVRNVATRKLDFFVALGDSIYADIRSPAVAKAQTEGLFDFRLKHGEVYSPKQGLNTLADLRASTALFATIDDHEVTNDFAGGAPAKADARFHTSSGRINQSVLYQDALQAFQEYNPIREEFYGPVGGDGRMDGARKLYRYRRFGLDAALFLLDARSFRDLPVRHAERNNPADVERFRKDSWRPGRTMLGSQQLADLKADLLDAQRQGITWKFVLIPEPIMQRGLMSAQDRFEGYAAERSDLLAFIEHQQLRNVVFVAADIHGTLVNNLTYGTALDAPQLTTHAFEVTVGPVAFYQTLGEVVIEDGLQKGYVITAEQQSYLALPIAPDSDNMANDRDDYVKAILNQELITSGFDPLGLEGSPIQARLLVGDYVALHSYGWSEFTIDAATQQLTITTWGVLPYSEGDLQAQRNQVLSRQPTIVSQFEVTPQR
ncbi:MAG: alkaline phosphatase D family protein [Caldilineaceae bacterium]